ncbi:MAG: leucyl/phenylalanyl-tRNA--protein transferase [Paracoccaceae bacterium]|jgi:leucyl/phenylalanyl-tRNA---protein transferase|nr:leucyl/phenylalanyl-tRNA--protein transferase [Paracoccaceae bacterium]
MTSEILPTKLLLEAYRTGLFPMADSRESEELFWISPKKRGVFPLDQFHISRSLARQLRKSCFQFKVNHDFDAVVAGCASRTDTWINVSIQQSYRALFDLGHAHTMEVYDGSELVGGVYGVSIGAAYFGESMFSNRPNTSKMALAYLVDRLRLAGFKLFDTQFLTPHLATLGAVEISQNTYLTALVEAVNRAADFNQPEIPSSPHQMIQRNTQTS